MTVTDSAQTTGDDTLSDNPLLTPSTLPYGLPDFTAIGDEHFLPAFRHGVTLHRQEIEAIAADTSPATFENTFLAFERSGQLLRWVGMVLYTLVPADGTEARQELQEIIEPENSAHEDAIYLDERLYARLSAVDRASLSGEEARLAEVILQEFELRGADLDPEAKSRLAQINERLAVLGAQYNRRMVAENAARAVLVTDPAALAGLSAADLSATADAARQAGHDDGHLLTLSMFTSQPWLEHLEDRATRQRLFEAAWVRGTEPGENYVLDLAVEQAQLRAEKAGLLGYATWADYALQDRTAPDLSAVQELLGQLVPAATANARREKDTLEQLAGHPIEPWDWPFYSAQVEREEYSVDAGALRPYFELNRTLTEGVFAAATALYGITFQERDDLVGYTPEVRIWEVFDADGSGMGLFLGDFYARPTKSGGAWMNPIRERATELDERPVVVNNLNIPRPPAGQPTLLTLDQVTTLFHEFGHALHGLLADARFASLSGTSVPRDFVEFPSQVNEMWIQWPEIVQAYARHVDTGEPLDPAALAALKAAALWGEGFATTEYLGAAVLDLAWHALTPGQTVQDPLAFEAEQLTSAGLDPALVPPRYRSSYYKHIFSGGYAAGYYSYIWSEVMDADTVQWFHENGGLSRANGDHFRAELLSRGNTRDPLESYRAFRGRDPEPQPLLERRGLA